MTDSGSRGRRRSSIRVRTAASFGGLFVVLAAGVLVFVNVVSQWAIVGRLPRVTPQVRGDGIEPDPATGIVPEAGDGAVVRLVADQQWLWSAVGIGIAGLVAAGVGWMVSRRMLRPVDAITRTAIRISATTLHERIALTGPDDELRRLADAVDDLLARLEASFDQQRQFIAHAAHELRTPLAVERAALQIGLHDTAAPHEIAATRERLLTANRRTEQLVERLLALAEADRGLDGEPQLIDLARIADEVLAEHARPARDRGVRLVLVGRGWPPDLTGDPVLVRRLLVNLVDNAVEYNAPGGWTRISGDARGFTVENTGLLVDPADAPALAEPFRRVAGREDGRHRGLGLSIVDAVVRAHGWRATLRARPTGGLLVRVDVSSVQPGTNPS